LKLVVRLPALPDPDRLADWCHETAAIERVQPWTVEKDFYLTRLIWALAQIHGADLLLKGGTCLYKVDLGYRRMSEDIDLTLPGQPSEYQSLNVGPINKVASSLRELGAEVGVELVNFDGERFERSSHAIWEARYRSAFLPHEKAVITVEAAIRPLHLEPRKERLRQLIPYELAPGYEDAFSWALAFSEVRAEKVRAAFTREEPAIRDFYDLGILLENHADMGSPEFRVLVNNKLAEINTRPLEELPRSFGLTEHAQKLLVGATGTLESVLRFDEPKFELRAVIALYDELWGKG